MEITVYRDQPLAREERSLPAATYNLAHTLLARSRHGAVFIPIRSMQILAIIDREEFVFLDSQYRSWVDIAWQRFHAGGRDSLDEPVAYEALYYQPESRETMKRLQGELHKALLAMAARAQVDGPARILKFEARRPVTETPQR